LLDQARVNLRLLAGVVDLGDYCGPVDLGGSNQDETEV
jgi:hypothetical protein